MTRSMPPTESGGKTRYGYVESTPTWSTQPTGDQVVGVTANSDKAGLKPRLNDRAFDCGLDQL